MWIKRVILGSGPIIIGIILLVWKKEFFLGVGAILGGTLTLLGFTKEDRLMWLIGGAFFLIGGILSIFFFPSLFYGSFHSFNSETIAKAYSITLIIIFLTGGSYMILRGFRD